MIESIGLVVTGMPLDEWITVNSVGEKIKLPEDFAD
jgi:hypothetical protein